MGTVKPETELSELEFHEATNIWRFNKGTNVIYRFGNFFYKVKPPDLSIEKLRLRMDKDAETGFTRFLYGIGSEASSENKKNSRRSKQNSIESISRSICEIYGFGQETSGGY